MSPHVSNQAPVCANKRWLEDLVCVSDRGLDVAPRGIKTVELIGYQSKPVDMRYPVITAPLRRLGYRFLAAEAALILSGDNKVETIAPYSRDISNFSDDGVSFFGAYGPKIVDQLDSVVESLLEGDHSSRQAVLNIWREKPPKTKDVPCTLSAQFLIREELIYCVNTMRSSDLWLGHPYDVFNFSMLSLYVALKLRDRGLDVSLGDLIMTAGSKHIYEKNLEDVHAVIASPTSGLDYGPMFDVELFASPQDLLDFLWKRAEDGKLRP